MIQIERSTRTTYFRVFLIFIGALFMFQAYGQTPSEDFNKLQPLFVAKKLNEGLPYFERIFEGSDAELKMKTAIFVQEKALNDPWISTGPSWIQYLKIMYPMFADLQTKNEPDARDFYCNGLYHYILGQFDLDNQQQQLFGFALQCLNQAYEKGYPGAIVYLAKAAASNQIHDAEITDDLIIQIYIQADQYTEKPDLLFGLVRTNMLLAYKHPHEDKMPDKKRSNEEIKRALSLFTNGMDAIQNNFSDNFPKIIADLWIHDVVNRSIYASSIVNEPEANLLIEYFEQIPATSASDKIVKAYTYNYLFQLFFLSNDASHNEANAIVSKIKKINKNDLKKIKKLIIDFEDTLLDDAFMSAQLGIRDVMGSYNFGKGKLLKK